MSYQVYWLENGAPETEPFGDKELSQMLAFVETLRKRQLAGYPVSHVTSSVENPDQVGKMGVEEPSAEVAAFWSKRRYIGPVGRK